MRVRGPYPRIYPTSHRLPRRPEWLLTDGEIIQWCRLFHEQHGWPWGTLSRTLGFAESKHLLAKLAGTSYLYDGERRRMSRQIPRILSGELVLSEPNKHGRRDAMIADHPVPIRHRALLAYDMKAGRLGWRTPPLPQPTLPSFKLGLEKFLVDPADVDSQQ